MEEQNYIDIVPDDEANAKVKMPCGTEVGVKIPDELRDAIKGKMLPKISFYVNE